MRLGWTKTKYSVSYYVQKTVYVNGKNKSMVVKRLCSEKYICDPYGGNRRQNMGQITNCSYESGREGTIGSCDN